DISVPRGAVITSATIQFTADEGQSETTALSIFVQASDDAPTFNTTANNLGSRPLTSLNVPWQPAAWNAGESNAAQRTPNLAALVQEITSRPGWSAGNAIAFVISGTGHRTADSADKSGGFSPRLTINYISPTPLYTVTAAVNSSANDAEQPAVGAVTLNSTDLELVNDGPAGNQTVGLRFENLAVPAGALISSANIQFAADEAQSEVTALTLRAQSADNAPVFAASANNLTARPLTTASIPWAPAAWNAVDERGPLQRTPDLSPLVSEVIARPGWSNGNAMAFLISGTGHRTADAADDIGGTPPTLTVSYWPEIPLYTYARWAAAHPNASIATADLDGDGYNNFFEYALGLDPGVPNYGVTPLVLNGASLELTYVRPANVTDVSYQVEWAATIDAITWSSAGVSQQILSDDGTHRTIRAIIPKAGGSHRFVRLKVTR
ncbi:MAG TPA: hypothetical protein VGF13_23105, partial [Verrucomicrobiae bacterium]